jgi:hypothetical protein
MSLNSTLLAEIIIRLKEKTAYCTALLMTDMHNAHTFKTRALKMRIEMKKMKKKSAMSRPLRWNKMFD